MTKIDPSVAVEVAIGAWRSLDDLVQFALKRHGYGNSDSGIGVTYANDLDDYDRQVDGYDIAEGHVEVYYCWGPPDGYEIQIPEWMYRNLLAEHLQRAGRKADAERIRVKPGWGLPSE
jgi:hypothetical protein